MPEVHQLIPGPITCHCWNGDRSSKWEERGLLGRDSLIFNFSLSLATGFAISPNNTEVHIYTKKGSKWEVQHVLSEVSPTTPLTAETQQWTLCRSSRSMDRR